MRVALVTMAASVGLFVAAAFAATAAYNILASILAVLQSDLLSRATRAARPTTRRGCPWSPASSR